MKTIAADIRFAEAEDASALAAIHAEAWQGAYRGIIPFRSLNAMIHRRGEDWWRTAIRRRAAILVMEFDGVPIGYATVGRNRTPALRAGGEIYEIYLAPAFQGLGFGRRLFDAARALLRDRGLEGTVIWALADNDNALRFYAGLGGADVAEGEEGFEGKPLRKIAFLWN